MTAPYRTPGERETDPVRGDRPWSFGEKVYASLWLAQTTNVLLGIYLDPPYGAPGWRHAIAVALLTFVAASYAWGWRRARRNAIADWEEREQVPPSSSPRGSK